MSYIHQKQDLNETKNILKERKTYWLLNEDI